jgi:hypothetical protein
MFYAVFRMQRGDDHPINRDESEDQPANPPLNPDEAGATDKHTSRLGEKYTVREAASLLGTSVDAVRGRLRRGSLDSMKVDGVVYVLLDEASRDRHANKETRRPGKTNQQNAVNRDQSELLEELRNQNEWLRREIEHKDTIIMSLTQRIPELEAPPEPRESPVSAHDAGDGTQASRASREQEKRSSWWRRFFGLENPA